MNHIERIGLFVQVPRIARLELLFQVERGFGVIEAGPRGHGMEPARRLRVPGGEEVHVVAAALQTLAQFVDHPLGPAMRRRGHGKVDAGDLGDAHAGSLPDSDTIPS
jgi:hypothetical protein